MSALPRGQRAQPQSLILDGYTADEQGARNTPEDVDPGLPRDVAMLNKSRFTTVVVTQSPAGPLVRESAQDVRLARPNRANPKVTPSLTVKQTNIPDPEPLRRSWLYLSPAAAALAADRPSGVIEPIEVSILYAVGTEMNRHGLRSFFEAGPRPRALITVPGVEPLGPKDPRWGIAIGDTDIRAMLQAALQRDVAFEVKVMAAFSTGINGLNQTLLNDLVSTGPLERIVIYDCLYSQSSGSTAAALLQAKRRCGSRLKLVAYKCTTGGNSLKPDQRLSVVADNPGLFSSDGVVETLFYTPAYTALIMFRSLEGGLADGSVEIPPQSPLGRAFAAMKAVVPKRGSVLSSRRAFAHVFGTSQAPAGKVFLDDWARRNAGVITAFLKHLGSKKKAGTIRELVWGAFLPGWPGGNSDGEENHDLLLPDFAHEFLPA